MKKRTRILIILISILVAGAGLLTALFIINNRKYVVSADGKTITHGSETYTYNENLINVLVIGVDMRGDLTDCGIVGQQGRADAVILVSLDRKRNKVNIIWINRDSMVDVARYTAAFEYFDRQKMQLCLQYAYGRSHDESSRLVMDRVNELFPFIPIAGYVTTNLDAVVAVNDCIGGVEVTLEEDMTFFDAEMTNGNTVRLKGQPCLEYLRDRRITNINNEARIQRQKKYVKSFLKTAKPVFKDDPLALLGVLNDIKSIVRTNLNLLDIANMAVEGLEVSEADVSFYSVPGESHHGAEYWEYVIDENGLQRLIVDNFYIKE